MHMFFSRRQLVSIRTTRCRVASYLAFSILVFGAASCGVTEVEDLFPSFPTTHTLTSIPGLEYTVGEAVNETLPRATGGNPPLTYSVTPTLPTGLSFNATSRTINGTPTTPQPHTEYDYTVTDDDGDTSTIGFGITVAAATRSLGVCRAGLVLSPGDSCTVGSERFEVLPDGRGRLGFFTAGTGIYITVQGLSFAATRIPGTNTWRIDSVS
ncbi:MAG: putative Ig domain-containing protein [Gammaproteobacteria bacterium]|nr:putative Ig domain-containing protein [Gammaproteobacteria bacterium]